MLTSRLRTTGCDGAHCGEPVTRTFMEGMRRTELTIMPPEGIPCADDNSLPWRIVGPSQFPGEECRLAQRPARQRIKIASSAFFLGPLVHRTGGVT